MYCFGRVGIVESGDAFLDPKYGKRERHRRDLVERGSGVNEGSWPSVSIATGCDW